ncbi:hypothetical protein HWD35_23760 [Tsukamurella tyrosinosolvens]|uniref:hypothetical protein n=1 Tax=Tsukamurella tyrosinosolvens TaxID=57704 RepID=UPI001CE13672|nr:hypothetical protein [Tsukamurella tyrosinosolvens]MCA4997740.1 hypothetical protein [Tsukamurella tyrosinosolvens]
MKIQNTWPTHKARARGRKARHRAMIRAQRAAAPVKRTRRGRRASARDLAAAADQLARSTYDA